MKIRTLASLPLFLAAAVFFLGACRSEPEKPVKPAFATVGGSPNAAPSCWLEDGALRGIGPECAKIALSYARIQVEMRPSASWEEALAWARDGRLDVVVGAFKTPEREQYLVFSEPYMKIPVSICVKAGEEFPFGRWDDLKGRKGRIGLGESCGEDFDRFAAKELDVERKPLSQCFADVASGKADYLVVDYHTGLVESWRDGVAEKVRFLDVPVCEQSCHLAFSKKSLFLEDLPLVNERIRSMVGDQIPEKLATQNLILWRNRVIQRSQLGLPGARGI